MSQTDGQTDDMRSQDRALHFSAFHGKNTKNLQLIICCRVLKHRLGAQYPEAFQGTVYFKF